MCIVSDWIIQKQKDFQAALKIICSKYLSKHNLKLIY